MSVQQKVADLRARYRTYAAAAQAAKTESVIVETRVQKLTPLPRITKDKETAQKVKGLRNKYVAVGKGAKDVVAVCTKKMRALEGAIKKTVEGAIKKAREEQKKKVLKEKKAKRKSASSPKKKKKSASSPKKKKN